MPSVLVWGWVGSTPTVAGQEMGSECEGGMGYMLNHDLTEPLRAVP